MEPVDQVLLEELRGLKPKPDAPVLDPLTGLDEKLHVIAVISNPVRYKSRYKLYVEFAREVEAHPQCILWTTEVAFGERPFTVTKKDHPRHLQLRSKDELWLKENMINLAIQRLPPNWKYVAWVDADLHFLNSNWPRETIHQLQHYDVVQLFESAIDMGPTGGALNVHKSFVSQYQHKADPGVRYEYWHPGYAWACTRKALDAMGGLIDWAILGSADHHMAMAFIGKKTGPAKLHRRYKEKIDEFVDRCERHIKRNLGYVNGTIVHKWHGKKKDRRYKERWDVLIDANFNPDEDIKRDYQGLYQLEPDKILLRDGIREYFRQRNEDSIDNV